MVYREEEREISCAQITLAWMLSKPMIIIPIVEATKPAHLGDAVSALPVRLTDDEIMQLSCF